MLTLSKQLDQFLLDLTWSLWTELGVAGVKRKHQKFLILIEELILLTAALSEIDPRLRDESLDWCSQYHHFCSISRLKSLIKSFDDSVLAPFSKYAATLNFISPRANWPLFEETTPLKLTLSHKSCLRPLESPALFNVRARSIFGAGARADIVTFYLTHGKSDFSASDLAEIGYSKRNLAEILEGFVLSGLFDKFMLRNQQRFRLSKNDQLVKVLSPIPEYAPSWWHILEIILPLRECIKRNESNSESTQVIEIRNLLMLLQKKLQRLNLTPPPFQRDFHGYLKAFSEWLLEIARRLAQGDFPDKAYLSV